MLVVTARAIFTAPADFSGSFTEPESGKYANSTPNLGPYFIYLEEEKERKEEGK